MAFGLNIDETSCSIIGRWIWPSKSCSLLCENNALNNAALVEWGPTFGSEFWLVTCSPSLTQPPAVLHMSGVRAATNQQGTFDVQRKMKMSMARIKFLAINWRSPTSCIRRFNIQTVGDSADSFWKICITVVKSRHAYGCSGGLVHKPYQNASVSSAVKKCTDQCPDFS